MTEPLLPDRVEGHGLLLRCWEATDAESLQHAVTESVEHLRPWMPWIDDEPRSLEQRRAQFATWERARLDGGDAVLGVLFEGAVAGGCGLHRRRGPGTLEIGYWIRQSFVRRGLATTASRLLTSAAFAVAGIECVEIHHDKANVASAGVPRRLGYRFISEQPDEPTAPGEIGVDCTWRVTRGDWLADQHAGGVGEGSADEAVH